MMKSFFFFFLLFKACSICSADTLYKLHFKRLNIVLIVLKQNRAQSATELLQELNNDVSGNFVEEVCCPKLVVRFLLHNVIKV